MLGEIMTAPDGELKVSFGYQCNGKKGSSGEVHDGYEIPSETKLRRNNSSFSCLSGAAISANATLPNTNICNGLIGEGILPGWDSPKSFQRVPSSPSFSRMDILSSSLHSSGSALSSSVVPSSPSFSRLDILSSSLQSSGSALSSSVVPSSPSFSRLDILSSSLQSSGSALSSSVSTQSEPSEWDSLILKSMSAPSRSEGFLNAMEVQVAGGAAGEDRVQAVCSEENGWLFCGIYDGFNGRDAADFLAGTLYETIGLYLNLLDWELKLESVSSSDGSLQYFLEDSNNSPGKESPLGILGNTDPIVNRVTVEAPCAREEVSNDSFRQGVLDSLQRALSQAESDFLHMVEQEMEDRPDLVSVGSCVLVVLLHGNDLYTLNLGDSRAVLATYGEGNDMDKKKTLESIQLTGSHSVDNEVERKKLLSDHFDDPTTIVAGKVKGKLKLTRAFGVGYLKKKTMNDALMGILRVQNLLSPPYVTTEPSLNIHRISKDDRFVIVGSDGLFDFFSNDEAVKLVHAYILSNPSGDPAKFLLEQLVLRAANSAGFSTEELMRIPDGRRRKYHDDVTVIVIILGSNQRTSTASTCL